MRFEQGPALVEGPVEIALGIEVRSRHSGRDQTQSRILRLKQKGRVPRDRLDPCRFIAGVAMLEEGERP